MQATTTRYVRIPASKVAALVGLHAYCDPRQALLDQWHANDRRGCGAAIARHAPAELVSRSTILDHERPAFQAAYERAMAAPDGLALEAAIAAAPEGKVRDAVATEARKDRGTRDEAGALDQVERASGVAVTERNSSLFRRELLDPSLGLERARVEVVGRVDGWRRDANEIVEVKNRARRFFDAVPLYERVQVQVYMWLTGAARCRLVQRFDGEVRETMVEADPAFLDERVWKELARVVEQDLMPLLRGDEAAHAALIAEAERLPEHMTR